MCLFLILLAFSPRIAAVFWWIFQPDRWDSAFSSWVWPVLGIVLLPWTTIVWVAVAPFGNLSGVDWVWLGFGFMLDVIMHMNNAFRGRTQYNAMRMPD